MGKTAFLLGGTGQIGRAVASALLGDGWEVTLASRGEREVPPELRDHTRHVIVDRGDTSALTKAVGSGVDLLVDAVAFEPDHARQLLSLSGDVGNLVVISSGSVYADDQGRTLDEAQRADELPVFRGPIRESQATVAPSDANYSTKKMAIERMLLEQDLVPVTIVRPWAIYGPGGTLSREWHFVKRVLDQRPVVLLADRGESRFQTTATANLAELIRLAAEWPQTSVFNCGDPDPPRVLDIARSIAAAMDHDWAEVLFVRPEPWQRGVEAVGDTPWSVPEPIVVAMSAAQSELGYGPVTTYDEAVRETCEWLVSATGTGEWEEVLTGSAAHMKDSFDYQAEDEFLRDLTAHS